MNSFIYGRSYYLLLGLIYISIAIPVYAQSPSDRILEREEERVKSKQRRETIRENKEYLDRLDSDGEDPIPDLDKQAGEQCFLIKKIVFIIDGEESVKTPKRWSFLDHAIDDKILSCVDQIVVYKIFQVLTAKLYAHGYITTRLSIPDQSLQTGVLRVGMHPGYVGRLYSDDKDVGSFLPIVFPFIEGKILNSREIERGLETIERLSSLRAEFQIVPADRKFFSDVIVRVTKGLPLSVYVSTDDSSPEALGEWTLRGGASYDNPLGFADYLTANIRTAVNVPSPIERYGIGVIYEIPYGRSIFSLNYNYDFSAQELGIINPLISESRSTSYKISWRRGGYRSKRFKSEYGLSLGNKLSRNFLAGGEIRGSRRDNSEIRLRYQTTWYLNQGSVDIGLTSSWGGAWLGAMRDPPGLSDDDPTHAYHRLLLDITYATWGELFDTKFNWISAFSGQYSDDILYNSEQFFIGSRYSVRGFGDEFSVAGEQGLYLRNEISFPLNYLNSTVSLGLDYGRVYGFSSAFHGVNELLGTFLTLSVRIKKMRFNISLNVPLTDQVASDDVEVFTTDLNYRF